MNIVVLLKQVPDLVEELEIDSSGASLDRSFMKFILNESDDHALEQALLLKERHGGNVSVFALDSVEIDDTLFTALAKGADAVTKVAGNPGEIVDNHAAAKIFGSVLKDVPFDLLLTGVQSTEDIDGQTGALLASYLGLPSIGVVSSVTLDQAITTATVRKEFPGGVLSELTVKLPAVLGIQAAEKPPRYVPIARIRQAQKTGKIEEIAAQVHGESPSGFRVRRLFKPEESAGAEMISGGVDEVVHRLVDIFHDKGIMR